LSNKILIKDTNQQHITIELVGDFIQTDLQNANQTLATFSANTLNKSILFEFKDAQNFDSAGMILIVQHLTILIQNGCVVSCKNMNKRQKALLIFYRKNQVTQKIRTNTISHNIFHKFGEYVYSLFTGFLFFLRFLGENFYYFIHTLLHPTKIRFKAITNQIELSGIRAIPIVIITSFLIGLVLAYQGADQLQQFGANIFIVEMVSISMIRELAPLITAIVIAGRSASSFTAEIGTMKITDEVDAMRTIGYEPSIFLVMPRVLGLMIALPLIVFLADLIGILGGMVVAKIQLDITFSIFIDRLYSEVELRHFLIGMAKAPIFGFIIALIGCYRGFQVTGSTDSIGKYTTISVVNAIFWVIALNAIFSVIFTQVGI
jgi:phospholipid/cholesterol/gamma-HCH transport system permease protein